MSSLNHGFSVELATKYGVQSAILISHFQFWIQQNKRLGRNFHDGRTWMYQTQSEIAACYPYWTKDQVHDILQKLVKMKVLRKGNYNKTNFDKTTWYAFENEEMFAKLANANIDIPEQQNGDWHLPTPIPDTKPDTKQIQQQQATPASASAAASFESAKKEKQSAEPSIYPCLRGVIDIPEDQKIKATGEKDETTVKNALEWAQNQKEIKTTFVAAFWFACNNKLKYEAPKKKETPYETLCRYFKDGNVYSGKECCLKPEGICFNSGDTNWDMKLDKYFSWQKFQEMCNNAKIPFKKE